MSSIIIKDKHIISDNTENLISARMSGGPKKTRIVITDHDTGEVIQVGSNKILVPGSQIIACKQFGLDQAVAFPTYNSLLGLENSKDDWSTTPANTPITCLWCAGRDGYGTSANEVLVVSNTDRIEPPKTTKSGTTTTTTYDMIPFRYVAVDADLTSDLRQVYFGRVPNATTNYISYYFKAFDTTPQLHVRYLDGTEVSSSMYSIDSTQNIEIYVEMRLAVTRLDFRDFFDKVDGWDNANISTISLLTGWYDNTICENPSANDADKIYYKWYQDVIPYSKWNFKAQDLTDETRAFDFNYQVYF